jgi:capsular polysaccharide biosynthesis protein
MTVLGTLLALAFSFAQPLRYSSTERVLITQANTAGVDPYTAIKSTERIAQNLSELIYTTSFFNAVMAKAQITAGYFPTDEIAKRELWKKTVETSVSAGTGVMSIIAYHTSRTDATELAIKVAQELSTIAPNYFGYSVRVQIIDDPLPSRFFAKPDFLKNALFGAVIGLLLGTAWVLGKTKNAG